MIGISHSRSVLASVIGLIVQILAAFAVFAVSLYVRENEQSSGYSLYHLAWLIAGGVPIWLGMLLVFDQKRRAAQEEADLEQLRREREAAGASTAIFEDDGRALQVAANRLEWMQRYLLPTFSLATGLALGLGGVYLLYQMQTVLTTEGVDPRGLEPWKPLDQWWVLDIKHVPVAIIVLSIVLLATFLFARYASGMGRVKEWQLLRAGGSYLLGSTLAIVLVTIGLGLYVYSNGNNRSLDYYLAWFIPSVMVLLGFEMLLNFILDLYRPRTPGVEPRAAFDSRLLGLFAEPGGIATSIAEAINYQFGFEVSKTWFYQLVTRSAVPLGGLGALTLWAMTTIVIVDPHEHAIIERWGRQVNADQPLSSGWHFKAPWPWDVVRKYNTGNVRQMYVGFEIFDAEPEIKDPTATMLWVQDDHFGEKHWEFMIPRPIERDSDTSLVRDDLASDTPADEGSFAAFELTAIDDSANREAAPVNLARMIFEVHYRISAENLEAYTRSSGMAHQVLLNGAWREATRFSAMQDIHTLLSRSTGPRDALAEFTAGLLERLSERAAELGLEIVYVGLQNVHPEKTVSDAFRDVVNAQAEKIARIREARGDENRILSEAAGRPDRARRLATAIEESGRFNADAERYAEGLRHLEAATVQAFEQGVAQLAPAFETALKTNYEARLRDELYDRTERDFNLGISSSQGDVLAAREDLATAQRAAAEADERLDRVLNELASDYPAADRERLLDWGRARMAAKFWDERLKEQLIGLQGAAAVTLSEARATRWQEELKAASEVTRLRLEREAFLRAPNVYRARLLYQALSEEYAKTRKYVLAFDPEARDVHIRYQAEETARASGDLETAIREGQQ